jgi:hypothetical protein
LVINVAEVLDSDFCENFTVLRTPGTFIKGVWTRGTTAALPFYGSLQPSTPEELQMVPEGDRVAGMVSIHTTQTIFETNTSQTSDVVVWRGLNYKVLKVLHWDGFGYVKCFATRMLGE